MTPQTKHKKTKHIKKLKKIKCKKQPVSELINSLVILPFCGEIIQECCKAMKKNRGLYTQCKKLKKNKQDYCSCCLDAARNHSTGKPPYGDIRKREELKENGMLNGILSYCDILDKLDATRYEVERDANRIGWKIPESEWITSKKKRGRPKKKKKMNIFVEDTDEEEEVVLKCSSLEQTQVSDEDIFNILLARSTST